MKISKQTMEILRNYASINQNILIKAGSTLTTRTVAKNLFATAEVDTVFPQDFGVYNLTSFLGVLSLFSEPDIEFTPTAAIITQGKNRVNYIASAPEVLDYPDKSINMPGVEVKFDLSEENLKSLLKAGAVLSSTDLKISGDGSRVLCSTVAIENNVENTSANTFSVDVGETDRVFDVYIKLDNLKLITGPYSVELSVKKIAKFTNTAIPYTMYIANTQYSKWVGA